MRYLLLVLVIIGLLSCNSHNSLYRYTKELPDSIIINDVILTVIQLDSLEFDADISLILEGVKVYSRPTCNTLDIGPPPMYSITFEDLYSEFNSTSCSLKQIEDSIFISLQTDASIKFKIGCGIYSRFTPNPKLKYLFYTPIFSFDKKFVFVQYCRSSAGECSCQCLILKQNDNSWILVDKW